MVILTWLKNKIIYQNQINNLFKIKQMIMKFQKKKQRQNKLSFHQSNQQDNLRLLPDNNLLLGQLENFQLKPHKFRLVPYLNLLTLNLLNNNCNLVNRVNCRQHQVKPQEESQLQRGNKKISLQNQHQKGKAPKRQSHLPN